MKVLKLDSYRLRIVGIEKENLYRATLQKLHITLVSDDVIARYDTLIYLSGLLRKDEIDMDKYDLSMLLKGLGEEEERKK